MTWTLEWNPTGETWNWHIKSYHASLAEAEAALEAILADDIHDSDPTHWQIFSE